MKFTKFQKHFFKIGICSAVFLSAWSSFAAFDIIMTKTHSTVASPEVLQIQKRLTDLDYFSYKATATYGNMTMQAIRTFQEINSLSADGRVGETTYNLLFSNDAKRNPIPSSVKIPFGPTATEAAAPFGKLSDWSSHIDVILANNTDYLLTDLYTGKQFNFQRTGGINHAKIEPTTTEDADIFLTLFDGTPNWSKRPVTVLIGDTEYAASLQGWLYGDDLLSDNGIKGSCDLYFENSKSEDGFTDEEHRKTVNRASGNQF